MSEKKHLRQQIIKYFDKSVWQSNEWAGEDSVYEIVIIMNMKTINYKKIK